MAEIPVIRTPGGEELVLLSRAEYEALLARIEELGREVAAYEDLEDAALLRLARSAQAEAEREGHLPGWLVLGRRRGWSPLEAARKERGLTQGELADRAGITQGHYSELESGAQRGADEVVSRLAGVLGIEERWLGADAVAASTAGGGASLEERRTPAGPSGG